jgi:DNA-binding PadR family transcriptional regulator
MHGYRIMQEVEERTEGALELGPGTLFRSIKQLLERGLIIEVDPDPEEESGLDTRRRSYSLTAVGRERTADEASRLRDLVRWAEDAMVLEGGSA